MNIRKLHAKWAKVPSKTIYSQIETFKERDIGKTGKRKLVGKEFSENEDVIVEPEVYFQYAFFNKETNHFMYV